MLLLEKHKLKGTGSRMFLANASDQYIIFGHSVLNSDFSFTSLDRCVRIATSSNLNDDSYFHAWGSYNSFRFGLNGTNGSRYYYDDRSDIMFIEHGDISYSDIPLKSTWTSTKGRTAGRKFVIFHDFIICEVLANGELNLLTVPTGNIRGTYNGANSGSDFKVQFLYETHSHFFVMCNNNYQPWLAQIDKTNWAITSFVSPVFGNYNIYWKLVRSEGSRFVFIGTTKFWYSYNQYYYFADFEQSFASYQATQPSTPIGNTHTAAAMNPSNLTLDQSAPTYHKWYRLGHLFNDDARKNDPMKLYRFHMKTVIDPYENPTDIVECTLNDMGLAALKRCCIAPDGNGQPSWRHSPETFVYTFTSNSGKEFLVAFNKAFTRATSISYFDATRHQFTMFEIDETDSSVLSFKQQEDRPGFGFNKIFYGVLKSWDNKTFVFFNDEGFFVFRFNETTERFEQSHFYSCLLRRISLTDKQEIVVDTLDDLVYIFNINMVNLVEVKFETFSGSIDFIGEPIQTNLIVNAYDSTGNRLVQDVSLTITTATFTDNSQSTITISTSATEDTLVSITINAGGIIKVKANIV